VEPQAPSDPTRVATTPWFVLHSDPWVNLHHVLHFQARTENAAAAGERLRLGTGPDDLTALDGAPEADRLAWRHAVDLYRTELAEHDLLFGAGMIELRNALARGGAAEVRRATAAGEIEGLPPALPDVLEASEAVYRRRLWPDHDRRNREWIAAALPALEHYGPSVASGLARAFGGAWPDGGIRVDVSVHGSWAGAYTSDHPDHIEISSTDPGHAGTASVESLFHEAGHTRALGSRLGTLVTDAFESVDRPAPERFWHTLLFYTAGELTRQAVASASPDAPPYEPYALKNGLMSRSPTGAAHWRLLDDHWRPFLEGREAREQALAAVARAVIALDAEREPEPWTD
jgi:hypothetical protein